MDSNYMSKDPSMIENDSFAKRTISQGIQKEL
jgi:hypothetical protein